MDWHVLRCRNTYADLIALDTQNGYVDLIADLEGFADSTGENKHDSLRAVGGDES
jgi:hypothetical protein